MSAESVRNEISEVFSGVHSSAHVFGADKKDARVTGPIQTKSVIIRAQISLLKHKRVELFRFARSMKQQNSVLFTHGELFSIRTEFNGFYFAGEVKSMNYGLAFCIYQKTLAFFINQQNKPTVRWDFNACDVKVAFHW